MEPVPSSITKRYPKRGPLQQFRFADGTAFRCFRCNATKKSKLITIYLGDWSHKLCNGCYGRLLSIFEIKAGTDDDDRRVERIADLLLTLVTEDQQREAQRLFRASYNRANTLNPVALRFIATAEHVAKQLESRPQLEWSPAVIGLCKAVETEVVERILKPLAELSKEDDLLDDRRDKDIGRIAHFCINSLGKTPELGTIAHFLQTVIHSQARRKTNRLIGNFLQATSEWTGSAWLLDPNGLHYQLTELTAKYRNRAAHIDELSKEDYTACRELVIGRQGIIWQLLVCTERHH